MHAQPPGDEQRQGDTALGPAASGERRSRAEAAHRPGPRWQTGPGACLEVPRATVRRLAALSSVAGRHQADSPSALRDAPGRRLAANEDVEAALMRRDAE